MVIDVINHPFLGTPMTMEHLDPPKSPEHLCTIQEVHFFEYIDCFNEAMVGQPRTPEGVYGWDVGKRRG